MGGNTSNLRSEEIDELQAETSCLYYLLWNQHCDQMSL